MAKTTPVVVTQPVGEPEVPAEIIATSIQRISDAMEALNSTRLKRSAIVTLIAHQSKLPRKHIEIVLNNLGALAADWLKPK